MIIPHIDVYDLEDDVGKNELVLLYNMVFINLNLKQEKKIKKKIKKKENS